jgi:hypothetical protein
MSDGDVKTVTELLAMGGRFYAIGGEAWCDTALDSWKLVPARGGYVRYDEEEDVEPAPTAGGDPPAPSSSPQPGRTPPA